MVNSQMLRGQVHRAKVLVNAQEDRLKVTGCDIYDFDMCRIRVVDQTGENRTHQGLRYHSGKTDDRAA